MKGNIRKLAVLVIITVIATFVMAATVTADQPGHRAIRGQYAGTGGGTCLVAPFGFNNLVPIGGAYDLMTFSIEAVFTFKRDGTGNVERTCPVVNHTGPPWAPYPFGGNSKDSWDFTYAIEPDGSITLTQVPGSHSGEFISGPQAGLKYKNEGRNRRGTVSPDGKTIILNGGLPDIVTDSPSNGDSQLQMICNDSAVLIWQHN
jgi:hypothetical protein